MRIIEKKNAGLFLMQAKKFQILNPIYAFTITALTVKVDIFLTILSPTLYIERGQTEFGKGYQITSYCETILGLSLQDIAVN